MDASIQTEVIRQKNWRASTRAALGWTALLWAIVNRGRRRIVGQWRRLARWEFWPPYLFYPPVVAYIIYLGVRFRSLTVFTAANPGIPAGGFVGESKYGILRGLKGAGSYLPRTTILSNEGTDDRLAQANAFMRDNGLRFPVVFKPDAGQRGSGVAIVRSPREMREYLAYGSFSVIVQEYVPGLEFGVFYYRHPDEDRGHVFSITEKRMPFVVGDGERTLEELVFADRRAVCMANFYLKKNAGRCRDIPGRGEKVQLVEIGTHCRGAIFLDGSHALTPALERVIDSVARRFEGFYFGRFDIRVPSLEDFRAGRNLKIVELNGVTSEATHIYDPRLTLFDAYRVLFHQWRTAFEIGDAQRSRGVVPTSWVDLVRMTRRYRRQAEEHPE